MVKTPEMRSLDTNIVVRALVRDNSEQAETADMLLSQPCYIGHTVFLETVWVLKSIYKRTRENIVSDLRDIVAMPKVTVPKADAVIWAIDRFADGADFPDALHLALSGAADSFASFDHAIARHADHTVVSVEVFFE